MTSLSGYSFGKVNKDDLMGEWGMGWFIGSLEGHTAYTAFGRAYGSLNTLILVPDVNLAVIMG